MSRGPPDRLKFRVVAATSEDPDHPVSEVHLLAPHSRGWRSEKFCHYPQEILLELPRACHLHQMQVLSHQYLIASRVDIHVASASSDPDPAGPSGSAFTKLGHFAFESNEKNAFEARELKTVKIDRRDARRVKLSLHRGHVNKLNIYNQVGVVSVNLIGWPADDDGVEASAGRPDASAGALARGAAHGHGHGPPGGIPSRHPASGYDVASADAGVEPTYRAGSSELVSVALEAGIDPFVMEIVRNAHRHKQRAVAREDYEEARR